MVHWTCCGKYDIHTLDYIMAVMDKFMAGANAAACRECIYTEWA